jgi:hypothetical protein
MPLASFTLGGPEDSGLKKLAFQIEIEFNFVQSGIYPISNWVKVIPEKLLGVGRLVFYTVVIGGLLSVTQGNLENIFGNVPLIEPVSEYP